MLIKVIKLENSSNFFGFILWPPLSSNPGSVTKSKFKCLKLSTFKEFIFLFFFFLKIKKIANNESVKHVHTELVGQDKEKKNPLKEPTLVIHGSGSGCPFFTGPKTSYPYPYFYFMFGHFQFSRSTKETPTNTVEDKSKTSQIYGWIGIAFVG